MFGLAGGRRVVTLKKKEGKERMQTQGRCDRRWFEKKELFEPDTSTTHSTIQGFEKRDNAFWQQEGRFLFIKKTAAQSSELVLQRAQENDEFARSDPIIA
jgi:1,2-phenylacetyl-CoA epoxidase catalytic subunit